MIDYKDQSLDKLNKIFDKQDNLTPKNEIG